MHYLTARIAMTLEAVESSIVLLHVQPPRQRPQLQLLRDVNVYQILVTQHVDRMMDVSVMMSMIVSLLQTVSNEINGWSGYIYRSSN